jgi:hypothetical protein
MKLYDNERKVINVGDKVRIAIDIPTPSGMLYKDRIVKIDELNTESKKIRVTDSLGKVWWIEPSQVSASFL